MLFIPFPLILIFFFFFFSYSPQASQFSIHWDKDLKDDEKLLVCKWMKHSIQYDASFFSNFPHSFNCPMNIGNIVFFLCNNIRAKVCVVKWILINEEIKLCFHITRRRWWWWCFLIYIILYFYIIVSLQQQKQQQHQ